MSDIDDLEKNEEAKYMGTCMSDQNVKENEDIDNNTIENKKDESCTTSCTSKGTSQTDTDMKKNTDEYINESIFVNANKVDHNKDEDEDDRQKNYEKSGIFKKFFRKDKGKNNTELQDQVDSLDIILESLYDAVSKAQRNIRINNISELDWYFPYNDEDGVREPRTMRIKLPSKTSNTFDLIDVPIYSLVNHNPLNIDEFNIKFKVKMNSAKKIKDKYDIHPDFRHKKYKICTTIKGNTNDGNIAEVELKCKVADTPEGINRIEESLDKIL